MVPERNAALRVLRGVRRGRRLDRVLTGVIDPLPPQARRWVHELVYGTVRLRARIDHLLERHLHRALSELEGEMQDVLRLGAYEVLYMDGVPAYAAVSQAVELARSVGGSGKASLANAVLRAVDRAGDDRSLFPSFENDPVGWLVSWGSHPRWLVERWLGRWSVEEVKDLVEANNRRPPLTLVPFAQCPSRAVADLVAEGIEATEVGGGTRAVRLGPGTDPAKALRVLPQSVIQDAGASLVVPFAQIGDGLVVDVCAAPGGKAVALAASGAQVMAADRSLARLRVLAHNRDRTGVKMDVVAARAENPAFRSAPNILVDAPCTGTGTLRRHPDGKWRLGPEDVTRMAAVQKRILDAAADVVSSGGLLVYSTCALESEENEEQVEGFLHRHAEFRMERSEGIDPMYLDEAGRLSVLPQRAGFDGTFAARFRKVA